MQFFLTILMYLIGGVLLVTPFVFIKGVFKLLFKKQKENGLRLVIFSLIILIIGYGTCVVIQSNITKL